jgi:hypothetical protein
MIRQAVPAHFVQMLPHEYRPGRVLNRGMEARAQRSRDLPERRRHAPGAGWLGAPGVGALSDPKVAAVFGRQIPRRIAPRYSRATMSGASGRGASRRVGEFLQHGEQRPAPRRLGPPRFQREHAVFRGRRVHALVPSPRATSSPTAQTRSSCIRTTTPRGRPTSAALARRGRIPGLHGHEGTPACASPLSWDGCATPLATCATACGPAGSASSRARSRHPVAAAARPPARVPLGLADAPGRPHALMFTGPSTPARRARGGPNRPSGAESAGRQRFTLDGDERSSGTSSAPAPAS